MKRRSGRHLLNCTQQHMAQARFRWKSNKAVSSVHHSRNKGRMHVDLHRKWLSLASANVLKHSVEGERMNDSNADRRLSFSLSTTVLIFPHGSLHSIHMGWHHIITFH